MKATTTFWKAPSSLDDDGVIERPVFTPEMNAAVAARHSRTGEGLEHILSAVDTYAGDSAAVEKVFRFIDFGHRSIADMVPVSIHLEGAPLWVAELIWTLVHTGGGQETSTRYSSISWDAESPMEVSCAEAYAFAKDFWETVALSHPEIVGIDPSMSPAKAERFGRNFVFDRARYFIPMKSLTNLNITTWGSEWIKIISALRSCPWGEMSAAGEMLLEEFRLTAPHLCKHTEPTAAYRDWWAWRIWGGPTAGNISKATVKIEQMERHSSSTPIRFLTESCFRDTGPEASLHVWDTDQVLTDLTGIRKALESRRNRYDPVGSALSSIPVKYGWSGVATAEIRDMNRHRPGVRTIGMVPNGFYFAENEIARIMKIDPSFEESGGELLRLGNRVGGESLAATLEVFKQECECIPGSHLEHSLMGTTFDFSHTSTLGHMIYECELRTGPGTHFRYRNHYRSLLCRLYQEYPLIQKFILEGSGEPE